MTTAWRLSGGTLISFQTSKPWSAAVRWLPSRTALTSRSASGLPKSCHSAASLVDEAADVL
eukprot:scaffold568087_cov22-Prasinocladus_malaysianus.AAC.1